MRPRGQGTLAVGFDSLILCLLFIPCIGLFEFVLFFEGCFNFLAMLIIIVLVSPSIFFFWVVGRTPHWTDAVCTGLYD